MRRRIVAEDVASIITRVGERFNRLAGKELLITGGTGFVGSYLLETLAALNDGALPAPCRVSLLTRNPEAFAKKMPHLAARGDFTILKGDVRDYPFGNLRCDYIIHGAAAADPYLVRTDPLGLMETISRGTLNVLRLAARIPVTAFLFLSSGAVYGTQPPGLPRIPEDFSQGPDLLAAQSGYGEGKRYAELLCSIYRDRFDVPVRIARLFTCIGPYLDLNAQYAAADFIRRCMNREPIVITSDGTPRRSYCYSADLAVALWGLLLGDAPAAVYNVGSDREISIADLARLIASCFDHTTEIIVNTPPPKQGEGALPARYVPDIARLKRDLDFALHYANDAAARRTIEWMKA